MFAAAAITGLTKSPRGTDGRGDCQRDGAGRTRRLHLKAARASSRSPRPRATPNALTVSAGELHLVWPMALPWQLHHPGPGAPHFGRRHDPLRPRPDAGPHGHGPRCAHPVGRHALLQCGRHAHADHQRRTRRWKTTTSSSPRQLRHADGQQLPTSTLRASRATTPTRWNSRATALPARQGAGRSSSTGNGGASGTWMAAGGGDIWLDKDSMAVVYDGTKAARL